MNIDYTVTALMFPAIPLIMAVYSNRFHTLSNLIRKIHDEYVFEKHTPPEWKSQLINLNNRISVLKFSILFAAFGFLFNMGTVFALYLDEVFLPNIPPNDPMNVPMPPQGIQPPVEPTPIDIPDANFENPIPPLPIIPKE